MRLFFFPASRAQPKDPCFLAFKGLADGRRGTSRGAPLGTSSGAALGASSSDSLGASSGASPNGRAEPPREASACPAARRGRAAPTRGLGPPLFAGAAALDAAARLPGARAADLGVGAPANSPARARVNAPADSPARAPADAPASRADFRSPAVPAPCFPVLSAALSLSSSAPFPPRPMTPARPPQARASARRPFALSAFLRALLLGAALVLMAAPAAWAQLAAGNIRPVQRGGLSKIVDIDYDLTGTTSPVDVRLQVSSDGGSTWTVPAFSLTGAIGRNVAPGLNLRITWDAGADWNLQVSQQMVFRLTATAEAATPGVPAGFALIPAGVFTMGDALDGISDAPAHEVITSAFYMAKDLVTKAEWDAVRVWGLANGYADLAEGQGKGSFHPVQSISWYQMLHYCNARSEKEGLTPVYYLDEAQITVYRTGDLDLGNAQVKWSANGYRLPTEAEWEKAARGGLSGKRFPWGDTISHTQANYYGFNRYAYDIGPTRGFHPGYLAGGEPYTSPVGSFAGNGYGLRDMAGNVWQRCWDRYGSYTGAAVDPRGPASGSYRVLRGGNFGNYADFCCVASRIAYGLSDANYYVGVRVLRSSVVPVEVVADASASFAQVPGGTFSMGDALDGNTNAPVHEVTVSTFYMAKDLVTKEEWDAVRAWGLEHGYADLAEGQGKAIDHPVHTISWHQMLRHCNARSEREGLTPVYYADEAQTTVYRTGDPDLGNAQVKWSANGYRLPTEAEWEKAARGGLSGKRFPWGDTISHSQANYHSYSSLAYDVSPTRGTHPSYSIWGEPYTSPSGSFAANGYGLRDMAGNLWQWCWDRYGDYAGAAIDPRGPASGAVRVFRGGNWSWSANGCSVAYRFDSSPGLQGYQLGFRVARSTLVPTGFAQVPAGAFSMGDALDGMADAPVHEVTVSAFYMAKDLVTKAEWDAVRAWGLTNGYTDLADGQGRASDHPVQNISWRQMVRYCNARSEQEGLSPPYYVDEAQTAVYRTGDIDLGNAQVKWGADGYRLPTEAEWEKAARGGLSGKRFPWGDTITHSQANYNSTSDHSYDVSATRGMHPSFAIGGYPYTSPVGSFAANGYGLRDMAGNVWQWCWDRSGAYAGAAVDPRGPALGAARVARGGSWITNADRCRAALRNLSDPVNQYGNLGFRVLRRSVY